MSADAVARPRAPWALIVVLLVQALVVQSAYLFVRADPTLTYFTNVGLHFAVGLVLAIVLGRWTWRLARRDTLGAGGFARWIGVTGGVLFTASALVAVALFIVGNTRPTRWLVGVHIALAVPAVVALALHWIARSRVLGSMEVRRAVIGTAGIAVVAAAFIAYPPKGPDYVIRNPDLAPMTMADEAMGKADGPFFPSSIHTSTKGRIPSNFFLHSESCGKSGCHPDITAQWRSSMHHFASFNNQFYRKSIEYMQSVAGVQASKWCAGCHDVALILDGKFDKPIQESLGTVEAQAGLACTACHAITEVHGTMGQGGYTIEYPPLHDLAVSENVLLSTSHDMLLRLDPAPHSRTFLKPFHQKQHADFCSACHKVHLDKPVNDYRWIRGFNDYDAWQASGVSGMGARSFYYPEKAQDCVDCHMPLVRSDDKGNRAGFVHEHRFVAANTAVPTANKDQVQLDRVTAFLKDKVTVDVFALARGGATSGGEVHGGSAPEPASHFPTGEEGDMTAAGGVMLSQPVEVVAPVGNAAGEARVAVRRGESVRLDCVVRTRGVGHFFPGGTVDAFDVWVELKAEDETGRTIFWSGQVEDGGKGPVEKGAHVYRSLMVDDHGNPINKRNAWSARALIYARLIPPGAADTVRFRLEIPPDCGNEIRITSKLNYRKFSHYYTQFAYAGEPSEETSGRSVAKGHDDRDFVPTADTSDVSGQLKEIPDLPIVVVNQATAKLRVLDAGAPLPPAPPEDKADRGRWNDYGIGMLLAGDLRAALHAFDVVCRLDPGYVDGWVNVARVRVREGDVDAALAALDKAFAIAPDVGRGHFLAGQALKQDGRLEEAKAHFEKVAVQFPRDRVNLNELARTCFLLRDYAGAVDWGKKVLDVDPEDVRAHYTLMLACRGRGQEGDDERAKAHEALYQRFKADEDAQVLTGSYRRDHPEDNNERQLIHEHVSVPLGALREPQAAGQ